MLRQRTVGSGFFDEAPTVLRFEQAIGAPRQAVWDSLVGPGDWQHWLGLDVDYTTDPPHGIGTQRSVTPFPAPPLLRNHERFFAWDEPHSFAFHFTRAPLPVGAFAERYALDEVPGGRTVLRVTVAIAGFAPARVVTAVALRRLFTAGLPKLARLLEERVAQIA